MDAEGSAARVEIHAGRAKQFPGRFRERGSGIARSANRDRRVKNGWTGFPHHGSGIKRISASSSGRFRTGTNSNWFWALRRRKEPVKSHNRKGQGQSPWPEVIALVTISGR